MTRREIGARIKAILATHGVHASVRCGVGTAYHWRYIKTREPVPAHIRQYVEHSLSLERLCGSYYSDCGVGSDVPSLCVLWEVARTRGASV